MNNWVWLDSKYLLMISTQFRNFKKKGTHQFNFSCPICGDSETNKRRARGYVFHSKGKLVYYCHNCHVSDDIPGLIKRFNPSLFGEYLRERITSEPMVPPKPDIVEFTQKMKKPKFVTKTPLKELTKVSQLPLSSYVKQYVDSRMIPSKYHHKLYYCKEFKTWVNSIIPGKFPEFKFDEERLIIPFVDKDGMLFGFQGRSLDPKNSIRYITIMLNEDMPKVFGLDTVDFSKKVYCVEGPFDSMFVPNCIASAGGSIISNLSLLGKDKEEFVIVYDREPRNRDVVKNIERAISAGYPVVIWPEDFDCKDINDYVVKHQDTNKLLDIINSNIYKGLQANLRLQQWKRI